MSYVVNYTNKQGSINKFLQIHKVLPEHIMILGKKQAIALAESSFI